MTHTSIQFTYINDQLTRDAVQVLILIVEELVPVGPLSKELVQTIILTNLILYYVRANLPGDLYGGHKVELWYQFSVQPIF